MAVIENLDQAYIVLFAFVALGMKRLSLKKWIWKLQKMKKV